MRRKLTALVALVTTACTGWRAETGPAPTQAHRAAVRSANIRIRLKTGETFDLMGAQLKGDSIVGYTRDMRPDFARRAVATSDVYTVSTYGFDGAKTALAVLGVLGAAAVLMAACVATLEV